MSVPVRPTCSAQTISAVFPVFVECSAKKNASAAPVRQVHRPGQLPAVGDVVQRDVPVYHRVVVLAVLIRVEIHPVTDRHEVLLPLVRRHREHPEEGLLVGADARRHRERVDADRPDVRCGRLSTLWALRDVRARREQRVTVVLRRAHALVVQADHLREASRCDRRRTRDDASRLPRQDVPREVDRVPAVVERHVPVVLVQREPGRACAPRCPSSSRWRAASSRRWSASARTMCSRSRPGLTVTLLGAAIETAPLA